MPCHHRIGCDCFEAQKQLDAAVLQVLSLNTEIDRLRNYEEDVRLMKLQVSELLNALKQSWCASTNDDHTIGDGSRASQCCPMCRESRALIARIEGTEKKKAEVGCAGCNGYNGNHADECTKRSENESPGFSARACPKCMKPKHDGDCTEKGEPLRPWKCSRCGSGRMSNVLHDGKAHCLDCCHDTKI